jgi:hypothetical protein
MSDEAEDDQCDPVENEEPGVTQQPETPETECLALLGDRAERVRSQVARLPPTIDRPAVFALIRDGVQTRRGHVMLDPEWCHERDEALGNLRQAIDRFKAVLRNPPAPLVLLATTLVETWAAGLDREFERIMDPTNVMMRSDRVSLGWVRAGRGAPTRPWTTKTAKGLRELGVSRALTVRILAAAGLTAPAKRQK